MNNMFWGSLRSPFFAFSIALEQYISFVSHAATSAQKRTFVARPTEDDGGALAGGTQRLIMVCVHRLSSLPLTEWRVLRPSCPNETRGPAAVPTSWVSAWWHGTTDSRQSREYTMMCLLCPAPRESACPSRCCKFWLLLRFKVWALLCLSSVFLHRLWVHRTHGVTKDQLWFFNTKSVSTARTYHDTYEPDRFQVQGPLRECRSIGWGVSRLPYYRTPPVCVSDVVEVLDVWRHNKNKNKLALDWNGASTM